MKHSIIADHLCCVGCVGEYSLKTSYTISEMFGNWKYQKHTLFIFTTFPRSGTILDLSMLVLISKLGSTHPGPQTAI